MMIKIARLKYMAFVCFFFVSTVVWSTGGLAEDRSELRLAVASNFSVPAKQLSKMFEAATGIRVFISTGSTGKLYAQIKNGAPYDVFLAANAREPQALEQEGYGVVDSRFTYAVGRLVVWCRNATTSAMARACLENKRHKIAIANPRLAPYGAAAEAVLDRLGLSQTFKGRLITGENIAQAFQMVWSGNVPVGLVALSQVKMRDTLVGAYWVVDPADYDPIDQQAIQLHGANTLAAKAFVIFLQSAEARSAIEGYGYALDNQAQGDRQ